LTDLFILGLEVVLNLANF